MVCSVGIPCKLQSLLSNMILSHCLATCPSLISDKLSQTYTLTFSLMIGAKRDWRLHYGVKFYVSNSGYMKEDRSRCVCIHVKTRDSYCSYR